MSDKTSLRERLEGPLSRLAAYFPAGHTRLSDVAEIRMVIEALARSEAQGEWVPVLREFRDRYAGQVDNRGEYPDDLHNRAIAMLAAAPPPADRAPGEVEWAIDFLDGLTMVNSEAAARGLGNVIALIRRLAARAPSAQGELIIDFPGIGLAGPFVLAGGTLTLPDATMADLAHHFRMGYTSAPAAGDGECPACRGTGMELDGSGRAIPREWCEKCDGEGRTP